jgi:hypothetical protein
MFANKEDVESQPYALAVTFSYQSEDDIQSRRKLYEQVKIKQREKIRTRAQLKM